MGRASSRRYELTGDQISRTRNLSDAAAGAFLRLVRVTYATKAAYQRDALAGLPRGVRAELERAELVSGDWFLPAREWARELDRNREADRRLKMSARSSARSSAPMSAPMSALAFGADVRTDTSPESSHVSGPDTPKTRAASRRSENVRTDVCTDVCTDVRNDVEPIRIAAHAGAARSNVLDDAFPDLDDTATTTDPSFDDLNEAPPSSPSSRVEPSAVPDPNDAAAMLAALEAARRRLSSEDRRAIEKFDTTSHVSTCLRLA